MNKRIAVLTAFDMVQIQSTKWITKYIPANTKEEFLPSDFNMVQMKDMVYSIVQTRFWMV